MKEVKKDLSQDPIKGNWLNHADDLDYLQLIPAFEAIGIWLLGTEGYLVVGRHSESMQNTNIYYILINPKIRTHCYPLEPQFSR
jgi:hypothetical protein